MKNLALTVAILVSAGCNGTSGSCSSDSWWTSGNEGSTLMTPGGDCTGCHVRRGEGPVYEIAGTVYFDYADADNCNGVDGAEVVVTDANGTEFTATSNAAGNFFLTPGQANVTYPASVVVRYQGGERAMVNTIADGNCNVCHTVDGTQAAPGRVIAP